MESIRQTAIELLSSWGFKVIGAIVTLIIGVIIARMIRGAARRGFTRSGMDATLIPFITGMLYYLLLACVLIAVMGMFRVQTTSFIAVLGAAGLAVGL